jgi:hypothetical protein
MSVLVISLDKPSLRQEYGSKVVGLLQCYRDQEKFFEMPLGKRIQLYLFN